MNIAASNTLESETIVVKTSVNEREIMTDPNQFGAAPENNQPNPQPEQPTQPLQPMQP